MIRPDEIRLPLEIPGFPDAEVVVSTDPARRAVVAAAWRAFFDRVFGEEPASGEVALGPAGAVWVEPEEEAAA